MQVFGDGYATADQYTLIVWIFFNDSSIKDGLDYVLALKTLFEGVLHCVALDKVVVRLYSFADDFNVHPKRPFVNEVARESLLARAKLL